MRSRALRASPILSQRCAQAQTTEEARFRIQAPDTHRRAARIIALDAQSSALLRRLADRDWRGGHFLVPSDPTITDRDLASSDDVLLRSVGGGTTRLLDELAEADVVVMVATATASVELAEVVGDACAERALMTAAFAVGERDEDVEAAVAALRPNAMVIVRVRDEADLPEILTALRA